VHRNRQIDVFQRKEVRQTNKNKSKKHKILTAKIKSKKSLETRKQKAKQKLTKQYKTYCKVAVPKTEAFVLLILFITSMYIITPIITVLCKLLFIFNSLSPAGGV
jgi:hypothetical protein